MTPHHFVVLVTGAPTTAQAHALAELPDRPLVQSQPRTDTGRITFQRQHEDPTDAIVSAIHDIETLGLRAVRLLNDDWVTLADIGQRIHRSRESVRLWSTGKNGPGGFPPPINPDRGTSFYSWSEVHQWLRQRHGINTAEPQPAVTAVNLALQLRHLTLQLTHPTAIHHLITPDHTTGHEY